MQMLKTISAMHARQKFGELMNEVSIRNDEYIVERAGKPLVAIIPITKYQKSKKERDKFFETVAAIQERVKDVDQNVIDLEIEEAVAAAKKVELLNLKDKNV